MYVVAVLMMLVKGWSGMEWRRPALVVIVVGMVVGMPSLKVRCPGSTVVSLSPAFSAPPALPRAILTAYFFFSETSEKCCTMCCPRFYESFMRIFLLEFSYVRG